MDFEVERLYYPISEVADMLDVNPSLIRFWEKEFPQLAPRKNHRGNRQFTIKDIELLKRIHHLVKEKGFTLEGAKRFLRANKHEKPEAPSIIERLLGVREQLNSIALSL
ncbi:MAG: MerR family transcriptional regulator [Flavobacteriales bacterium]|nr:MerR family transcriptional regulator [Flavobacteriales bacterium]